MTVRSEPLRQYPELDGKTFVICVGAMKCATSWLYHYLATLQGVTVSPLKEIHFFDALFPTNALGDMEALSLNRLRYHLELEKISTTEKVGNPSFQACVDRVQMAYDKNAYFGHFARLCSEETQVLCDITPAYSAIGSSGFEYMRGFCNSQDVALKIIYVMRDPVDRLWSQLRHLQEINPEGRIAERWAEAIKSPQICARADYQWTVIDLDATFSSEQILYLFYEDLFTEAALTRLCNFLGVDYEPGETNKTHNRTRLEVPLPEDAQNAFLSLLEPQYVFCRERFGDLVPESWCC